MKRLIIILTIALAVFGLSSCDKECNHKWSEATCTEPSICEICRETKGERLSHNWQDATCQAPKTCATCKITTGAYGDHSYSEGSCTENRVCAICQNTLVAEGHKWELVSCMTEPWCKVCNETKEARGHDFIEATCLDAKHCSDCGEIVGEPLGHTWTKDDCDEIQSCITCEYRQAVPMGHKWQEATCKAPKTCIQCEKTEGKKLSHSWIDYDYIEPSCNVGKQIYKCQVGGETREVIIPAVIDYHVCNIDGVCTTCKTDFDTSLMTIDSIVINNSLGIENAGIFISKETGSEIYKQITLEDIGMPIVELNGDISRASKNSTVRVPFTYVDETQEFECIAEVKVQGASSAGYPKKNYNIKLYNEDETKHKVKLVQGWGKQFKYCMKANYVDFSQARNVVSGKIYGDIIKARDVEDELSKLKNGGAIDGYPILVFNQGKYLGLYTMNIPKDKWMFEFKDTDEKDKAIVMAETWNDTVAFRAPIGSGFELEFASNEESLIDNDTSWVFESLNELIKFTMNNNGEDFKNGISQYADVDKCIDSMLYTFVICADDNISKNILWVTFDGKVWFSSVYDMDGTWGMRWNGKIEFDENTHLISNLANGSSGAPERNHNHYNLLWEKIYINFYDRVVERYQELRKTALSIENITAQFGDFFSKIPDIVYEAERAKWTGVPTNDENFDHYNQIIDFATKRLAKMDTILVKTS